MATVSLSKRPLVAVLLLSLGLNLWGICWGLPQGWHPDEVVARASVMFDGRSLNHHYFAYGALHYYQVIAGAILPVRVAQKLIGRFDTTFEDGLTLLLARFLSVLMAVGIVWCVYLIGKTLFSRRAGLWAALLLALSMGFVNLAHFATTEIPSMFWFTLSCLMSAYALKHRALRWYLLAGLCAGLSAAVKYIGGLSVLPLVAAHALAGERRPRRWLLSGIAMSGVGFVMGNPVVLFAFPEFLEGFVKESAYNTARGEGRLGRAFVPLITHRLVQALGLPLCLLSLAGLAYSLWLAKTREHRATVGLVWAMVLPYYLVMGMQYAPAMRYIVPIIPILLVLAGKLAADWLAATAPLIRRSTVAVMTVVLGYSALYTIAADLSFVRDSRYLARDWVLHHVPEGASIEMTAYGPELPRGRYQVAQRPINESPTVEEANAAKQKPLYHAMQRWLYALDRHTAGPRADGSREGYTTWYEREIRKHGEAVKTFDLGVRGLEGRRPDYLVTSSLYTRPLLKKADASDSERQFMEALVAGRTSYQMVAQFQYRLLPGVEPELEFVNGTMTVFARTGAPRND